VTALGHSFGMRRFVLALLVLALVAPAATLAKGKPVVPQFPRIPGKWSHVELNVMIKKQPHTLALDRGRVVAITATQDVATQLAVREPDGTLWQIPVAPDAIVTIDGRKAFAVELRRKMNVMTLRVDDGAAVRVRATT